MAKYKGSLPPGKARRRKNMLIDNPRRFLGSKPLGDIDKGASMSRGGGNTYTDGSPLKQMRDDRFGPVPPLRRWPTGGKSNRRRYYQAPK